MTPPIFSARRKTNILLRMRYALQPPGSAVTLITFLPHVKKRNLIPDSCDLASALTLVKVTRHGIGKLVLCG